MMADLQSEVIYAAPSTAWKMSTNEELKYLVGRINHTKRTTGHEFLVGAGLALSFLLVITK